ncbi:FAD-dependent oxidoreductase [Erythrobacter sp. HA6-11]
MKSLDIAISGCGPAGLAAALLLQRDGHNITLFDQFESPGPVGSGLMIQPTGLAVLDQLGLACDIVSRGSRIDALKGLEEHGRVALDAHYEKLGLPGAFGIGIHRASLFDVLYQRVVGEGIPIETGRLVRGSEYSAEKRWLVFQDGSQSAQFDLLVDANGWQTPFDEARPRILPFGALWASLPSEADDPFSANLLEQRYRRAAQMVGVLPIGQRSGSATQEVAFFWSLKRDDYPQWRDTSLDEWKADVLRLWPEVAVLLDRITDREQLTFAQYAHRTAKRPVSHRMIAIGDAWHSASPQLGQGANMALLDAWSLARGLQDSRTVYDGLSLAHALRKDHVDLYQWITALFTPLYQSDSKLQPWLRDRVLAPISQVWPISKIQASLMSGLFGFPLVPLGLSSPDYSAIASRTAAMASSESQ